MTSILKFSKNWGGKLNNKFFTTIRRDKGYWQKKQGEYADVWLTGLFFNTVKIQFVVPLKIEDISESLSQFDAGLTKKKFVVMLEKMYGKNPKLQLIGLKDEADYRI